MQAYFWVKTLHIVMMTAWMAAVVCTALAM